MAKQFTLFENALQFAAMFSGLKRTFSEEFNSVQTTDTMLLFIHRFIVLPYCCRSRF